MYNYTLTNFHQIKKKKLEKKNPNILSQIDIKKKLYSAFSIIEAKVCKLNTRLVNSIDYVLCFGL